MVGVVLRLINRFIPMAGSIKTILNAVVVIAVVLWLLSVFGVLGSLQISVWGNSCLSSTHMRIIAVALFCPITEKDRLGDVSYLPNQGTGLMAGIAPSTVVYSSGSSTWPASRACSLCRHQAIKPGIPIRRNHR